MGKWGMELSPDENQIIKKDKEYWEGRQNLFGFFSLLLEVDRRVNPHFYKKQKAEQENKPKERTKK